MKKCFPSTTWVVTLSAGSNLQPHIDILPVAKGLIHALLSSHPVRLLIYYTLYGSMLRLTLISFMTSLVDSYVTL